MRPERFGPEAIFDPSPIPATLAYGPTLDPVKGKETAGELCKGVALEERVADISHEHLLPGDGVIV